MRSNISHPDLLSRKLNINNFSGSVLNRHRMSDSLTTKYQRNTVAPGSINYVNAGTGIMKQEITENINRSIGVIRRSQTENISPQMSYNSNIVRSSFGDNNNQVNSLQKSTGKTGTGILRKSSDLMTSSAHSGIVFRKKYDVKSTVIAGAENRNSMINLTPAESNYVQPISSNALISTKPFNRLTNNALKAQAMTGPIMKKSLERSAVSAGTNKNTGSMISKKSNDMVQHKYINPVNSSPAGNSIISRTVAKAPAGDISSPSLINMIVNRKNILVQTQTETEEEEVSRTIKRTPSNVQQGAVMAKNSPISVVHAKLDNDFGALNMPLARTIQMNEDTAEEEETVQASTDTAINSSADVPVADTSSSGQDVQELAKQVTEIIKRELIIEKERLGVI